MDIISYGAASKVSKEESYTRNDVLGQGVEGDYSNVKARVDHLEKAIQGVVEQADNLIVKDAINIMKAHAKLNAIAKIKKYNMHNMVFDDLLDLSGIDTTKSSGYTHDAVNGELSASEGCVIETKEEVTDAVPNKVILTVEEQSVTDDLTSLIPEMTSNTTPSGEAFSNNSDSQEPYKVFKMDGRWGYNGLSGTPPWIIGYKFEAPQIVQEYRLLASQKDYYPKSWRFEASNNGVDYTTLHTAEGQGSQSTFRIFQVNNQNEYVYYRFVLLEINGHPALPCIDKIEMYGGQIYEDIQGNYSISRDNGTTWEPITPDTLFYFKDSISPQDNKLKLKAELPEGTKILNCALTWA